MFARRHFFADPAYEITRDAALFRGLEENGGRETLRFWECRQPTVVVGSFGRIGRQVHEEACLADHVPILRRITGGAAVVIGRGCLNYSLLLSLEARPELRDVDYSYRFLLRRIMTALALPDLQVRGLCDLTIGQRKVSGNAQRRGKRALLHHGTVLYDFDISAIERYLKIPERQPAYRAGRSHSAFVTNAPLGPRSIEERMARVWEAEGVTA